MRPARLKQALAERAQRLHPAVDELRALVCSHEPIELMLSVAVPTSLSFERRGPRPDDAEETVTWPAKIEYLLGLALSAPPATGSTPKEVTDRVMDLIDDIFDAARAEHMMKSFDAQASDDVGLDAAVFMLRDENIIDRMPGYARHLQFDRHKSFYLERLGFSPSDVARVVRTRLAADNRRVGDAFQRGQRTLRRDTSASAHSMAEMLEHITASRIWNVAELADDVGTESAQLRAMLAFFSARFGVQPDFRLPTERNAARTRPCVDLGNDNFFLADPWSVLGAVHLRLAEAASDPGSNLTPYRRHREAGHQRIVTNALQQVFNNELTWQNQHYSSYVDGPGEIDVLVAPIGPLSSRPRRTASPRQVAVAHQGA